MVALLVSIFMSVGPAFLTLGLAAFFQWSALTAMLIIPTAIVVSVALLIAGIRFFSNKPLG